MSVSEINVDSTLTRNLAGFAEEYSLIEQEEWPELVPFCVMDLPDFPTHALPDALREFVDAESHATQTPPSLAGLLVLATCSAVLAREVEVEPRPGWREPVNLFVAVLLGPGNRKSAVFSDVFAPLRKMESEQIEAATPEVAREQSERRQAEASLKKLEKKAAEKGDLETRRKAGDLAAALAEQPEPVLPRLLVDDATAEKIGIMLDDQGGRIMSASPEGGVFDHMAGLYSKNGMPQFDVYLKGHSGDDLVTDRVSRKSVRVKKPALTCAYAVQPQVVKGIANKPAFRGRGLLARFLYSIPHSWVGIREISPTPVSDSIREEYDHTVRSLIENFQDKQNDSDILIIQLTSDARKLFEEWELQIEKMLADGGRMESMRDWGAKLAGATLRIAAVIHCVEYGPDMPISHETIVSSVEIAQYLIPHAEAVLNLIEAHEDSSDARYVLRWIERHNTRSFKKSDAQQDCKRRFPRAEDIDLAIKELIKRGYIREVCRDEETPKAGRPGSPLFEVNPVVFDFSIIEKRSKYSKNSLQNTSSSPGSGNL